MLLAQHGRDIRVLVLRGMIFFGTSSGVLDRVRGPLLLEANARPGLAIQISNARGLVPEIERVDRELGQK